MIRLRQRVSSVLRVQSEHPTINEVSPTHRAFRAGALAMLVLLLGVSAGILLERNRAEQLGVEPETFTDLSAVSRVIQSDFYYRPSDPDSEDELASQLEQDAITGMLRGLDDQYTRYLSPPETTISTDELAGRVGSPGFDVSVRDGQVTIAHVYEDLPADAAGLVPGDVIQSIDGENPDVDDLENVLSAINGTVGSTVDVGIAREDEPSPVDFTLERVEVVVPAVLSAPIADTSYTWIRVTIFGDQTTFELDAALADAISNESAGIVLDLRSNGGGWVTAAQEALGRFLDPTIGPALYEDLTPGAGGPEGLPIYPGEEVYEDIPIIVLVDEGTASASEIVAGALQDYDRALVIGEGTFGKGSVQRIFTLSDGASVRITVGEWFTPNQARIQEEGIQPNIVVASAERLGGEDDDVLQTAIVLLDSDRARPMDLTVGAATAATPVSGESEEPTASPSS